MAEKTITEAQKAQQASKKSSSQMASTTAALTKSFVAITGLNGKLWYVDSSQLKQLPLSLKTATFARIANPPKQICDYSTEC